MKKLLSLDSPIVQFMEHVADFFLLNLLTVLCCVPLITAGAALTAHIKVMQNLVMDEDQPVMKAYFQSFVGNFKQATVFWMAALLMIVLCAADVLLIRYYFHEAWVEIIDWVLLVLGTMALGVLCYAFPLIARYENTLKEHLRNSIVLAVGNLPRTLLLVILAALPVIMAALSLELFFNTVFIWFIIGVSITLFLQALILRPVFRRLEPEDDEQEA